MLEIKPYFGKVILEIFKNFIFSFGGAVLLDLIIFEFIDNWDLFGIILLILTVIITVLLAGNSISTTYIDENKMMKNSIFQQKTYNFSEWKGIKFRHVRHVSIFGLHTERGIILYNEEKNKKKTVYFNAILAKDFVEIQNTLIYNTNLKWVDR